MALVSVVLNNQVSMFVYFTNTTTLKIIEVINLIIEIIIINTDCGYSLEPLVCFSCGLASQSTVMVMSKRFLYFM